MRLQPHIHLDIQIDVKSPGMGENVDLAHSLIDIQIGWVLMVMRNFCLTKLNGDQSHFVHSEEVVRILENC